MSGQESIRDMIWGALLNSKRPQRSRARQAILLLVVVILAVWGLWATSTSAAPRLSPEQVALTEWYDSLVEPSTVVLDSTGWSDAERVGMVAATYAAVMQWDRQQTWQPGFKTHLEIKGFTDVEIREIVLAVNGEMAVQAANAVFAALGKPSP